MDRSFDKDADEKFKMCKFMLHFVSSLALNQDHSGSGCCLEGYKYIGCKSLALSTNMKILVDSTLSGKSINVDY